MTNKKVAWNKGKSFEECYGNIRSNIIKDKISKSVINNHQNTGKTFDEIYGENRSKIIRLKISARRKGIIFSTAHRKRIGDFIRGKTYEEIFGVEKSNGLKYIRKIARLGQKYSKDTCEKISDSLCGIIHSKESYAKGVATRKKNNSYELSEKHLIAMLKGLLCRPTNFEKKIILLIQKYNLQFDYVGDGRVLIGYKNPDFINKKEKIIIEVFLNYFKIRDYGSIENYMDIRQSHFARYGYHTIFITEEDITNKNWEDLCINKIKGGINMLKQTAEDTNEEDKDSDDDEKIDWDEK